MKCLDHDNRDAVGKCKPRDKGICRECAVDMGKGLACRGRCEQDVSNMIERGIFHALREEDVRLFIAGEFGMVASHGGVVQSATGLVHPRNYGTFPRILADYARGRGEIGLESAVRKMTSFPASKFRLPGRGVVGVGYAADLVLFDPATIRDRAKEGLPRHGGPVFRPFRNASLRFGC